MNTPTPAKPRAISPVRSLEPSSTTMISLSKPSVSVGTAAMRSSKAPMDSASLYAGMTMERSIRSLSITGLPRDEPARPRFGPQLSRAEKRAMAA